MSPRSTAPCGAGPFPDPRPADSAPERSERLAVAPDALPGSATNGPGAERSERSADEREVAEATLAAATVTPGAAAEAPADAAPADAAPAPAPLRGGSLAKLVLLLGSMSALGALSTDIYLPSLPQVAAELGASTASVQFTITGTLLGGALGQLVIGPLSDRFGRRAPVFVGVTLHIVTSLLCLLVGDVAPLIALRVLQGIGNASAGVVAVAVIRDRLSGAAASAVLSRLMLVVGVAPLFAPSIGSALAHLWGWRSAFVALAIYGAVLLVVVWRFLPETNPPEQRSASTLAVMGSYGTLLRDRTFLAYAVMPGLSMSALFAYVAGAPFVLQEGYGLSQGQFAVMFAVNGLGLVAGAQVNAALVKRVPPARILRFGLPLAGSFAVVLLVIALTGAGGLLGLLIPLFLMLSANAVVAPNASAIALTRHGRRAGAAAALIGAAQAGVAGLVAPLVGVLGGDAVAMAVVMVGAFALALLVLATGTRVYRAGGFEGEARPADGAA